MGNFILDTSALRGLRRDLIESVAAQGHSVSISPVTFWELMCHLDEDDFCRAKGRLMKCRAVHILEDPRVEVKVDVGAASIANESQSEDRLAIPRLLEELDRSDSLEQFYSRQAPLRAASQTIGEISPRVRDLLDGFEKGFVAAVKGSAERLLKEYGFQQTLNLIPRQFVDEVALLARRLERGWRDAGMHDEPKFGRILNRVFLARGYGLVRTQQYIRKAGPKQLIVVDQNDTEDYFICFHLSCTSDRILVTDDRGTLNAVCETIRQLGAAYEGSQEKPTVLARVMSCHEFRAAVGR
jgi:hypothetical protein